MKKEIKGFILGSICTLILTGLAYGSAQLANVYLSPFDIKLNGNKYNSEMPVLNYQGRTYLALRELGTVLGNEIDFINDEIIINTNNNSKISNDISKLDEIYTMIKGNYYGKYSKEKLEEGAIRGLVNALEDKYSVYMDEEEFRNLLDNTEGEYTGIGLYLTTDSNVNLIQVVSPIKDSPAYLSDIKPGDYIIEVDGIEYTGADLNKATKQIKNGKEGTYVELTIKRDDNVFKVSVRRENIQLYEVEHEIMADNIGYINIKSFDANTYADFYDAYFELINEGVNGIVVDLRNNPGGLLNEVINICNILIPKGNMIISTVDVNGNKKEYTSNTGNIEMPLVVLVNERKC